jgi:hypothetical protein
MRENDLLRTKLPGMNRHPTQPPRPTQLSYYVIALFSPDTHTCMHRYIYIHLLTYLLTYLRHAMPCHAMPWNIN